MLRNTTDTPVRQKNDLQGHICTIPQSCMYCNGSNFSQTAKKISIPLEMDVLCQLRQERILPTSIRVHQGASLSSKVPKCQSWDKQKDQGCSINEGQLLPGSQCCCPRGSLPSTLTLPITKISPALLPPGKAHLFGSHSVCVYLSHINTLQQLQRDDFRELLDFGKVLFYFQFLPISGWRICNCGSPMLSVGSHLCCCTVHNYD